jgi:uncharacterized protein YndB with AHSA1/START domain
MRAEASTIINKPIETVFTFTTDSEKITTWSTIKEVKRLFGSPVGVGTKDALVIEFLGQKIETTTEVTAYDPPHRYAYKSISGPVPFENTLLLTSIEGGTKVDLILEGEPGGLFKMAGPAIVPLARKQLESQLSILKKTVEAQG